MSGLLLFFTSILLMLIEIPVGLSLFFSGSAGIIIMAGFKAWFSTIGYCCQPVLLNNTYMVIPMFLLMGQIAAKSNISVGLVKLSRKCFGNLKSGAGISCIFTSALFGAICGSSIATISSLGSIFYKVMKRNNYSDELIFGIIAVGGTLGVLIPPSIVLIVYAIAAQESIGKLFSASIPLSLIAVLGYIVAILIQNHAHIKNENFQEEEVSRSDKIGLLLILVIFLSVLIGMYKNVISPAECASIISFFMVIYKIISDKGQNNRWIEIESWLEIFNKTAKSTGMIIFIFLGANVFNAALSLTSFPNNLSEFILKYSEYPLLIILLLVLIFLFLGCIMDGLAMVLLFAPLLYPIITKLNILPQEFMGIWFGILMLTLVEIGMITPPVGINLFVIKQSIKELSNVNVLKSVKYFIISDFIRIGILVLYPQIIMWTL